MFWKTFLPLCNRPFTKNKSISHFTINFVFPAIFQISPNYWAQELKTKISHDFVYVTPMKIKLYMGFLPYRIFTKAIAHKIWCILTWNWGKFALLEFVWSSSTSMNSCNKVFSKSQNLLNPHWHELWKQKKAHL